MFMELGERNRMRKGCLKFIIATVFLFAGFGVGTAMAGPGNIIIQESSTVEKMTPYIRAVISLSRPGFERLAIDSLGKGQFRSITFDASPVTNSMIAGWDGLRAGYYYPGESPADPPRWSIQVLGKEILIESHWSAAHPPEPLVLAAENQVCHVTLLGAMNPDGSVRLPAVMHLPDEGSLRISVSPAKNLSLGYSVSGSDHGTTINVAFPPATKANPALKYRLQVDDIHPAELNVDRDPRFDAVRRDWLNILQMNPRRRMLANNAGSDTCAFCYYEFADIALHTPPLAKGLNALDLVRETLDSIIAGTNAYGMPGYGDFPEFSADTYPSLIIAVCDCAQDSKNRKWAATNFDIFAGWTEKMLATDTNGDGLIKYSLSGDSGSWPQPLKYRPANWWDTIGFGYEDAYANALAYRALRGMQDLAKQLHRSAAETRYQAAANKLQAVYFKTFYDQDKGVIAGWRSADGELHNYYFLWVNGIAIHYGLVPHAVANTIMDRLLAKMKEVGYDRFDLGLPGNLVPVPDKDYVDKNPRFGGSKNPDGYDGFQIYENGGATACFAYFTMAALYDLDRIDDGDRIYFPMMNGFAAGDFQGRCDNGYSKDWKNWSGGCWGYEGFLVDNYYALLASLDRQAALKRAKTK